jgi:hypothetical protein
VDDCDTEAPPDWEIEPNTDSLQVISFPLREWGGLWLVVDIGSGEI